MVTYAYVVLHGCCAFATSDIVVGKDKFRWRKKKKKGRTEKQKECSLEQWYFVNAVGHICNKQYL